MGRMSELDAELRELTDQPAMTTEERLLRLEMDFMTLKAQVAEDSKALLELAKGCAKLSEHVKTIADKLAAVGNNVPQR